MKRHPPIRSLAAGLIALLALIAISQQWWHRSAQRAERLALEQQRIQQSERSAAQREEERAERLRGEEMKAALNRGPRLPSLEEERKPAQAESKAEARDSAGWENLRDICVEALRRSGPSVSLQVKGGTGFQPAAGKDPRSLGFEWDQGIRLEVEAAEGGSASRSSARIDCYFLQGRLVRLAQQGGSER